MTSATINLRQRVRDSASRIGLPRFWRWWMGELAPLLPRASRAALQRRFARPVIELADGQAIFWRAEVNDGVARLAATESVSLSGDSQGVLAAGRAAVARLASSASAGIAAPRVIVALAPRQVLRKELTLPSAVEENLVPTLAFDLDRHTPFRADQLYFDAAVKSRDGAKKTLRVDWVAALKTIVDAAQKQVQEWGAIPVAIVPGPPTTAPARLNLLPSAARPRTLQLRRWQVWAPLALLALLVAAAVFVPLVQKRQYAIALADLNAQAGQQAAVADKLRQQLEQMQNEYNYVLAKKYAFPSVVHVLDEVTRALPDDTWITQLELKTGVRAKDAKDAQRDLYLRGESANAGKLISLLEDSKLVEQVAPRSPTTKIQGAAGEIFDLGAHVRALPATIPVVLAELPPVRPSPDAIRATAKPSPSDAASATPSRVPVATSAASAAAAPIAAAARAEEAPTMFGPFPPGYVPPAGAPAAPALQRGARAALAPPSQAPLPPSGPSAAPGAAPAAPPAMSGRAAGRIPAMPMQPAAPPASSPAPVQPAAVAPAAAPADAASEPPAAEAPPPAEGEPKEED